MPDRSTGDLTPPQVLVLLRDAEAAETEPARRERLQDLLTRLLNAAYAEMKQMQKIGITGITEGHLEVAFRDDTTIPGAWLKMGDLLDARLVVQAEAERELLGTRGA